MKKIITLSGFAGVFLYFLVLGGGNVSCNKDTDCLANITILDSVNMPVPNATILVTSPNGGVITTTAYTNSSGFALFNFKLPAVLNVAASAADTGTKASHIFKGNGVLELQAGKTIYLTINIH